MYGSTQAIRAHRRQQIREIRHLYVGGLSCTSNFTAAAAYVRHLVLAFHLTLALNSSGPAIVHGPSEFSTCSLCNLTKPGLANTHSQLEALTIHLLLLVSCKAIKITYNEIITK
jgi:hypothetical protein